MCVCACEWVFVWENFVTHPLSLLLLLLLSSPPSLVLMGYLSTTITSITPLVSMICEVCLSSQQLNSSSRAREHVCKYLWKYECVCMYVYVFFHFHRIYTRHINATLKHTHTSETRTERKLSPLISFSSSSLCWLHAELTRRAGGREGRTVWHDRLNNQNKQKGATSSSASSSAYLGTPGAGYTWAASSHLWKEEKNHELNTTLGNRMENRYYKQQQFACIKKLTTVVYM